MSKLHRLIGALMLLAGLCGIVVCTWALIDPSIMAPADAGNAFAPPSPRWRAAFGLVFSLALALFGGGRLRHRALPDRTDTNRDTR